jgi:hypothetical protein
MPTADRKSVWNRTLRVFALQDENDLHYHSVVLIDSTGTEIVGGGMGGQFYTVGDAVTAGSGRLVLSELDSTGAAVTRKVYRDGVINAEDVEGSGLMFYDSAGPWMRAVSDTAPLPVTPGSEVDDLAAIETDTTGRMILGAQRDAGVLGGSLGLARAVTVNSLGELKTTGGLGVDPYGSWRFSTGLGNPTSGNWTFENSDTALETNVQLNIHATDNGSVDRTRSIEALVNGDSIYLQVTNDGSTFVRYKVTGPAVLNGSFYEIPVSYFSEGSAAFSNFDVCAVYFYKQLTAAASGHQDDSEFAETADMGSVSMGLYAATPASLTDGNAGALAATIKRGLHVMITASDGTEMGTVTNPFVVEGPVANGVTSTQNPVVAGAVIKTGFTDAGFVAQLNATTDGDLLVHQHSKQVVPADGLSNALGVFSPVAEDDTTVMVHGVFPYYFDGLTAWDRFRGDKTDGLLVNLGLNNDVVASPPATTAATYEALSTPFGSFSTPATYVTVLTLDTDTTSVKRLRITNRMDVDMSYSFDNGTTDHGFVAAGETEVIDYFSMGLHEYGHDAGSTGLIKMHPEDNTTAPNLGDVYVQAIY